MEPVALPMDYNSGDFYVPGTIEVGAGQELFIPSGSRVTFNGGRITVRNGGRLTFGGTPSFASKSEAQYRTTLQVASGNLPIYLDSGSKLKVPTQGGTLKYSVRVARGGSTIRNYFLGWGITTPKSCPAYNLYCRYDVDDAGRFPYREGTLLSNAEIGKVLRLDISTSISTILE